MRRTTTAQVVWAAALAPLFAALALAAVSTARLWAWGHDKLERE